MKELHLISFNYPYPPSYGGIIDVYYKIKALSDIGIKIHLHCFVDSIPETVDHEIKSITANIFFYKKKKNPFYYFSAVPFAAAIRTSDVLFENLMSIEAPILFEGLQTTEIIRRLKNKDYKLYLRFHNNEAEYYKGLSSSEKNIFKKIIYRIESVKFAGYQKKLLKEFESVFCLSEKELNDVNSYSKNARLIHIFHGNESVKHLNGKGDYFLFHGDLSISDNKKALEETISMFKTLPSHRLVVASDRAGDDLKKKINNIRNISLVPIETDKNLRQLFENAHANILLSYQNSGTKVKLFNALYNSRFVIINENITDDSALTGLCRLGFTSDEIRQRIIETAAEDYNENEIRSKVLEENYSDDAKAEEMSKVIFKSWPLLLFSGY
ncbi:hypothetical protein [Chryseobacterium luteum]|uniref:Mannosyltransferase n=1 Tax=Chryseobacterium luteum TaxID=421531 RepID=A0A085ZXR2_9FLAO|nr:hypothetical protein [Chryseobacterium luteum]KFF09226.1 hypothetical protein IX38_01565 [Chryseobacterium luteum]